MTKLNGVGEWLKVDNAEMFLGVIELQKINAEYRQARIVGIPDRSKDLGTGSGVQDGHADQSVFVTGKRTGVHPLPTSAVFHIRHVLASGADARRTAQIGEILFHELKLIFPEWHVV